LSSADGVPSRFVRFDAFELDTHLRELHCGEASMRLQSQPFEILMTMLERPGKVVSRDALVERLWPDGTFVDFEHSLNAAVRRLRAALGDDAGRPRFVETIPRRGYRFIAAFEPPPDAGAPARRPRVAVLPFTGGGDEAGTGAFGDGSSLAFMAGAGSARDIGATLRADYLVEGSVRRHGEHARIAAWLVETSGETQVWSDVYDRSLTDALVVQADVAARVIRALASHIPVRPMTGA
jgi:DNA-binding winged helix-turn-helix (wHTH) protein